MSNYEDRDPAASRQGRHRRMDRYAGQPYAASQAGDETPVRPEEGAEYASARRQAQGGVYARPGQTGAYQRPPQPGSQGVYTRQQAGQQDGSAGQADAYARRQAARQEAYSRLQPDAADAYRRPAPQQNAEGKNVYDGYERPDESYLKSDEALLSRRSRSFSRSSQNSDDIQTRMTQTGYQQTVRQQQRPAASAAPVRTARPARQEGDGEEPERVYQRPTGRTNQRPAVNTAAPARVHHEQEEQELEEERGSGLPRWLVIALMLLALLVILGAGLYFIPESNSGILGMLYQFRTGIVRRVDGLIHPAEPPAVISFSCDNTEARVGDVIRFRMTTVQAVTSVGLIDQEGSRVSSSVVSAAEETDGTRVWELDVYFSRPYENLVFASTQQGTNVWNHSDKSIMVFIRDLPDEPEQTADASPETVQQPGEPAGTEAPADSGELTFSSREREGSAASGENADRSPAATATPRTGTFTFMSATPEPEDGAPQDDQTPEGGDDEYAGDEYGDDEYAGDEYAGDEYAGDEYGDGEYAGDEYDDLTGDEETGDSAPVSAPAPTAAPATPAPAPTSNGTPPPPTPTPLPKLTAVQSSNLQMVNSIYIGGKLQRSFNRETPIMAPNPDLYSYWEGGVFTFRGDNFRRNASFGTANIAEDRMTILWQKDLSSLKTSSGTLYGVGWTGQPAIVKWVKIAREMMTTMYPEKRAEGGLREVIFAAQDGNVYFLDLRDGTDTRAPISIGYPLKGSVSVYTQYSPLISFGQGVSKLAGGKTGAIGHYLYSMIDGSRIQFINGRQSNDQKQYSTNGAFDGTALMIQDPDYNRAGDMVVAGENGLLYTVHLNLSFTQQGLEAAADEPVYLMSKAKKAEDTRVGVEGSVAMYNQYVFFADSYGALRCVDTTTMSTVWSADMGDNTDASIALDLDENNKLWLYTGNTNAYRLVKKDVSIRRLNAMTGEIDWTYNVSCVHDKTEMSGCKASPVIGQKSISNLVFFTVNKLTEGGSKLVALDKKTGSVVWQYAFTAEAVSSPVAVYNDAGDSWLIQADQAGVLHMFDARSGQHLSELDLGGEIQASPAVYRNILVIGTCSKGNARMYGIELK